MSEQTTKLNCSFCGKEQSKVKKLIANGKGKFKGSIFVLKIKL